MRVKVVLPSMYKFLYFVFYVVIIIYARSYLYYYTHIFTRARALCTYMYTCIYTYRRFPFLLLFLCFYVYESVVVCFKCLCFRLWLKIAKLPPGLSTNNSLSFAWELSSLQSRCRHLASRLC